MSTKILYTKDNPNGAIYPTDFELPDSYEKRNDLLEVYPELKEETPSVIVKPMTKEDHRNIKLFEINKGYSTVMAFVQAGYPQEEVLSWERQATQARQLIDNPTADAAFVRTLAKTKNISVEEMCQRILTNAASWEPIAAMLTGQRQLMEEAVFDATTIEEIQSVIVKYSV